jgi:membrane-bound serine protease (ClpP class)
MKLLTVLTLCCFVFSHAFAQAPIEPSKQVFILEINGIIGPATADYIERSFDKSNQADTEFILLKMDTPGGLDLSMRSIIKKILASPIPVVTYVAPGGARAASAGTYILYASHIAAMAPGTNLGAATPVQMIPSTPTQPSDETPLKGDDKTDSKPPPAKADDTMSKKIINDAVAYIQSLAALRGRNAQWAEQAVREAVSLPSEAALKENVIDIVANSQFDLFKQLDGRKIKVLGEERTLSTSGIVVHEILPDWRNKLLEVITNPNIAFILMLVGIYGLIFEFANPGAMVPGTVGAICLLLALFSFQVLPINYAGLALIVLGIGLMTAEAFQPSFGVLGLGGVVAFVSGSVILIDTDVPGYGIDLGVIAGFTVTTTAFFILALGLVFKARRHPIVSGQEQMLGANCVVVEDFEQQGRVLVHSEVWQATTTIPMKKGDKASVQAINGLILDITPNH